MNRRRFAVTFAVLATVLLGLYYLPGQPAALEQAIPRAYACVAGFFLRAIDPGLRVQGTDLLGGASLRIVKTCDAMDVTILLASALLAWPRPWPRRLLAL